MMPHKNHDVKMLFGAIAIAIIGCTSQKPVAESPTYVFKVGQKEPRGLFVVAININVENSIKHEGKDDIIEFGDSKHVEINNTDFMSQFCEYRMKTSTNETINMASNVKEKTSDGIYIWCLFSKSDRTTWFYVGTQHGYDNIISNKNTVNVGPYSATVP